MSEQHVPHDATVRQIYNIVRATTPANVPLYLVVHCNRPQIKGGENSYCMYCGEKTVGDLYQPEEESHA